MIYGEVYITIETIKKADRTFEMVIFFVNTKRLNIK